jgi:hypothetical protein
MIFIIGAAIAFFLVILLVSKKHLTFADSVLALLICTIAFNLLSYYSYISGFSYRHAFLLGIDLPVPLIYGPLLLVYVQSLTGREPKRKLLLLLHCIPMLVLYVYQIPFFLLPSDEKITYYLNAELTYDLYSI